MGAKSSVRRIALLAGALVAVLLACTTTPAKKPEKFCTPGKYVFCRCRDRQEGQKLCKDDGENFGPCEPCETFDNPEVPLEPGDPGPDEPQEPFDGGPIDRDTGPRPSTTCGDGVVQQGEDCDDKDANDADGCDRSCKLAGETPPLTGSCPGLDVHVWGGAHEPTLRAKTTGSGNRTANPACAGTDGTTGAVAPDRIFKVIAHKTGALTVAVTEATFDAFLYASDACMPTLNTYLTCANKVAGPGDESITVDVTSGKAYYVFVDGTGAGAREGDFRVSFSIP